MFWGSILSKRPNALALASYRSLGLTTAISFNDRAIWEAADWQLPPEKGLTEVTAGLSTLPGCPRLWPCVIPCASQTLPQHTVTCLVTSCAVAIPFPITQAHALLYPVYELNPPPWSMPVSCYSNTAHCDTHRWPLIFLFPHHAICVCTYPRHVCVYDLRKCVCFHLFSQSTAWWFGISSMSKQQLQQPWHISECFFSSSLRKWSAPRLLIPLHSTVHQGDFVFTA